MIRRYLHHVYVTMLLQFSHGYIDMRLNLECTYEIMKSGYLYMSMPQELGFNFKEKYQKNIHPRKILHFENPKYHRYGAN